MIGQVHSHRDAKSELLSRIVNSATPSRGVNRPAKFTDRLRRGWITPVKAALTNVSTCTHCHACSLKLVEVLHLWVNSRKSTWIEQQMCIVRRWWMVMLEAVKRNKAGLDSQFVTSSSKKQQDRCLSKTTYQRSRTSNPCKAFVFARFLPDHVILFYLCFLSIDQKSHWII